MTESLCHGLNLVQPFSVTFLTWPYNNAANVVLQQVNRFRFIGVYWNILTENSRVMLNANSGMLNVKLCGYKIFPSINLLWDEMCAMMRQITTPSHYEFWIYGTIAFWPASFLNEYLKISPLLHKANRIV